ncbi:twin arginine-targeting protein translocase TatB [Xaviernesmea oryzae]|uniref:Sec-independent protein translocase protein TatB n=1 Tax=Xaviernesmea oryzae TaxID=464029 RepID=A0A1Q9AX36_9HYPH|nr:Sec-independent protein translocase protein TatB [Xaviernesmea oryzae]OLP59996.1 twin arginine-targeting protein translocase TatB [Xaviernesmea oryzae]SEK41155.1 sec-independent protein translocase protein TatB [Xaviernesmea oryzae]
MLDVGWTELVVIAVVMIIFVGPKELPGMLRTFGRMMSRMRGMAGDFRRQFDDALREADLDEVRRHISDAQRLNPAQSLRDAMNPLRQMGNEIKADLHRAVTNDPPPQTFSYPSALMEDEGAETYAAPVTPVRAAPAAALKADHPKQARPARPKALRNTRAKAKLWERPEDGKSGLRRVRKAAFAVVDVQAPPHRRLPAHPRQTNSPIGETKA